MAVAAVCFALHSWHSLALVRYSSTVYEEHALLLFSRRPENSDWILEWWPMGKIYFEA